MKVSELFEKYCFHDSLLESILTKEHEIVLEIDFCYWQQVDYRDDMPETGLIRLVFSRVSAFEYEPYETCSDEIVNVICSDVNTVLLEVYNDYTDEYHKIKISADRVDFIEQERTP